MKEARQAGPLSSLIPHPFFLRRTADGRRPPGARTARGDARRGEDAGRGVPRLPRAARRSPERWKGFRLIDAAVAALVPGLRTAPDVGAVTPVPPAPDLPQVPGYELFGEIGR